MHSPVDENIPTLSLRRVCEDGGVEMMTKIMMNRDRRNEHTLLRGIFSRIAWDRAWSNDFYSGAGWLWPGEEGHGRPCGREERAARGANHYH
jgi:hypothetical protein